MQEKLEVGASSNFYVIEPNAIQSDDITSVFPFDVKKACIVRLQALANGAIYVLQQKTGTDATIAAVKELVDKRSNAINAMTYDPAKKKAFFNELRQFNLDLAKAAGLADKDIALGEAFWAWQEYKRPENRAKTYQDGDLIVTQTETLLCSPLTSEQKTDLLKIHLDANSQPKWFKKLPDWAQASLKSIVPTTMEGDWSKYQNKIIPATLRHIPGQANATKHELTIKNGEQVVSHTTAYKQGVPTSYDMPAQDRQASATQNVAQMLGDIGSDANRKKAFNSYWDIPDESSTLYDTIKPPVFLGGLLTPSSQGNWVQKFIDWTGLSGKENNSTLDSDKSAAIQFLIEARKDDKANYFDINVPLNGNRNATPVSVDKNFLEYANSVSAKITAQKPEDVKATQLAAAVKLLGEHDKLSELPGRNKNLYTAALYELTTRLMGGCSTGNCKSSKDRKGVELMMADAMMIYYAKYNKFPKCDDKDEGDNLDRTNFINIFVNLYNSGHQLYIAHDNSPGSAGIKDEKILDKDIIKALGESYTKSKEIAEFNKPKTFFDKHAKKIPGLSFILFMYETVTSWFKNPLSGASSSSFDGQVPAVTESVEVVNPSDGPVNNVAIKPESDANNTQQVKPEQRNSFFDGQRSAPVHVSIPVDLAGTTNSNEWKKALHPGGTGQPDHDATDQSPVHSSTNNL